MGMAVITQNVSIKVYGLSLGLLNIQKLKGKKIQQKENRKLLQR